LSARSWPPTVFWGQRRADPAAGGSVPEARGQCQDVHCRWLKQGRPLPAPPARSWRRLGAGSRRRAALAACCVVCGWLPGQHWKAGRQPRASEPRGRRCFGDDRSGGASVMRGGRGAWEKMAGFAGPGRRLRAVRLAARASKTRRTAFLLMEDAGCAALALPVLFGIALIFPPAWTVTACSWAGAGRASVHSEFDKDLKFAPAASRLAP